MMRYLGKVEKKKVVLCTGWDALRGIIGREEILQETVLVFENCPIIHSMLVKKPFWVTFISHDKVVGREYIRPQTFSGFYQLSALCLETINELTDMQCKQILDLL